VNFSNREFSPRNVMIDFAGLYTPATYSTRGSFQAQARCAL
jgi:hypothetical protein